MRGGVKSNPFHWDRKPHFQLSMTSTNIKPLILKAVRRSTLHQLNSDILSMIQFSRIRTMSVERNRSREASFLVSSVVNLSRVLMQDRAISPEIIGAHSQEIFKMSILSRISHLCTAGKLLSPHVIFEAMMRASTIPGRKVVLAIKSESKLCFQIATHLYRPTPSCLLPKLYGL